MLSSNLKKYKKECAIRPILYFLTCFYTISTKFSIIIQLVRFLLNIKPSNYTYLIC